MLEDNLVCLSEQTPEQRHIWNISLRTRFGIVYGFFVTCFQVSAKARSHLTLRFSCHHGTVLSTGMMLQKSL